MKNVHKKVLSFVSSRRFGNNPFISRMFLPLGQNQTFTVHARQMMYMLFETCAREELNKLELYVHAAGGKRFKFEDNPSFFSLSGCSATGHLLDHRHFHVLGVVGKPRKPNGLFGHHAQAFLLNKIVLIVRNYKCV